MGGGDAGRVAWPPSGRAVGVGGRGLNAWTLSDVPPTLTAERLRTGADFGATRAVSGTVKPVGAVCEDSCAVSALIVSFVPALERSDVWAGAFGSVGTASVCGALDVGADGSKLIV